MLLSLNIKNAALISELKIEFGKGLNTLSGETGAGKSIIIDSLMFSLGSKADRNMIRSGENVMSVEAVFDVSGNFFMLNYLKEIGYEDDVIIIYRTLNNEGKSTISLNGRTITLSMLREITQKLTDIYSQSEHVSLLKQSTHCEFLDGYGGNEISIIKKELNGLFQEYKGVCSELDFGGGSEEERERLIDLYSYQINEIEEANVTQQEENELLAAVTRLANIEKITNNTGEALKLFNDEPGINSLIYSAKSLLQYCIKYDEELTPLYDRLQSAALEIEDISAVLSDYINNLEYNAEEAEKTEKRLDVIRHIKRKYGKTITDINAYLEKSRAEYQRLISSRENIAMLLKKKELCVSRLYDISQKLSSVRKKTAERFEKEVMQNLNDLSMKDCKFKVVFNEFPKKEQTEDYITHNGMDKIEFFMSANKGESLKPLAKIISGGEMSRFMLAVKSILSDTDDIDTLIFDEIDTGISGVTATAVAKKFAVISKKRQIIAITHLPQIAAMADVNFLIEKKVNDNLSYTLITKLDNEAAITEVSRLIGAADISTHARLHAEEMMNWSENFKRSI